LTEPPPNPPENAGETPVLHLDLSSPPDGDGVVASGDQVAALQDRLVALDNKLYEERFLWVLTLVVMFDVLFLMSAQNWAAPIVVGVLQLIGLAVFADKCRVNPIMPLLDKLTGMLGNGKNGN